MSTLGLLLWIPIIVLLIGSPKKLRTLGRMVTAFVVTAGVLIIPNAFLRIGDPRAFGSIAGLLSLLAAAVAGWWHIRSLARAREEALARAPEKLG